MKKGKPTTARKFPFANRLLTGLVIALSITLTAFEWTTVKTEQIVIYRSRPGVGVETILPPITYRKERPEMPKPKTNKPSDQMKFVKDILEPIVKKPIKSDPIAALTNAIDLPEIDKKDFGMNDDDIVEAEVPYRVHQIFAHYEGCKGLINEEMEECSLLDIKNRVSNNFEVTPQLRAIGGKQGALMLITVDEEGDIVSIETLQTTSKAMSRAATKAIQKLPRMNPAQQQGKKVALSMKVPIVLTIK